MSVKQLLVLVCWFCSSSPLLVHPVPTHRLALATSPCLPFSFFLLGACLALVQLSRDFFDKMLTSVSSSSSTGAGAKKSSFDGDVLDTTPDRFRYRPLDPAEMEFIEVSLF